MQPTASSARYTFYQCHRLDPTFAKYLSLLRTYDMVKKSGRSEEVALKESHRIDGQTWCGYKHGSSFVGHQLLALGSVCYQVEGCRVLATADAMDIMAQMPNAPEEVTPEMGPDLIKAGICCCPKKRFNQRTRD
jgi:hypothetical protein